MRLAVLVRHVEVEVEHALVAAAQHGERAVRGQILDGLGEVEIVGELGAFLGLGLHHLGLQDALAPFPLAQGADQGGLLADALDQDVAGAVERGLGVGDALAGVDILGGFGCRVERRIGEQRIAERLEPGLAGDLRLGAALGLVRRVQVFQLDLGLGAGDGARQFRCQLALLLDAFQDGRAPILQLAQVAEALLQLAELRVVEAARLLFAVARNERHGRAFAQ